MDAARELAQLLGRRRRAPAAASSSSAAAASGSSRARLARAAGQRQRDQPLLGAVVQVALEPAALVVGRLHDPRARGAQLLDLRPQLGVEPLVLERERGRCADRLGSAPVLVERSVVDDRADRLALALDRAGRPPAPRAGSSTGRPSAST